VVEAKNPDLTPEQKRRVAQAIGMGAIRYPMLSIDNNKIVTFDWETAIALEGNSAPYLQNAHVRANSILKKAGALPGAASYHFELSAHEVELIDLISRFPAIVQMAAQDYKPLHLANYVYELAKTFHSFYHVVPVLQAETDAIRDARLRLVAATQRALAGALQLLGIEAPDLM
jgi:arginyl-tRNA synthetase